VYSWVLGVGVVETLYYWGVGVLGELNASIAMIAFQCNWS